MGHIIHIAQILLATFFVIMYPIWLGGGYLEDNYLGVPLWIPTAIGTYGAFFGGIWWYAKEFRNL